MTRDLFTFTLAGFIAAIPMTVVLLIGAVYLT